MKKIILGITAITLSICLTACGNSSNETSLTNLGNQLDETSNTIVDMQVTSPSSVALGQNIKNGDLAASSKNVQQLALNEQYYKAEILEKTAQIKNNLDQDVKLSKSQISALKDLVLNLDKNTLLVKNTMGEMLSSEKAISALKKDHSKNAVKLSAKYNKLACTSNIRMAYYENILNTLEEIEHCLNITDVDNTTSKILNIEPEEENKTTKHLQKNIDTFRTADNIEDQENNQKDLKHSNADTYGPSIRNIDTYNPYRYGNMPYGYGAMPYGGYGMPYRNRFMRGYPGGMYGSNYYNRATSPQNQIVPVTIENNVEDTKPEEETKTEAISASLTQNIQNQHKLKNKKDDPVVVAF